jgi:hypothetical protein
MFSALSKCKVCRSERKFEHITGMCASVSAACSLSLKGHCIKPCDVAEHGHCVMWCDKKSYRDELCASHFSMQPFNMLKWF